MGNHSLSKATRACGLAAALFLLIPFGHPSTALAKGRQEAISWEHSGTVPMTTHKTFFSAAIGTNASYLVYLPPSYKEADKARYPLLFFYHGGNGSPMAGDGFVAKLDDAIRRNLCPEVICVLPNGLAASWYVDSLSTKQPVETVIVKDLYDEVNSRYKTLGTRETTGIVGFSMGGNGALHHALEHRDKYGLVWGISGAVQDRTFFMNTLDKGRYFTSLYGGDEAYLKAHHPPSIVEAHHEAIKAAGIKIQLTVGDDDTGRGGNIYQAYLNFSALLKKYDIPHTFYVAPGVGHSYNGVINTLGDKVWKFLKDAWGEASRKSGAMATSSSAVR